MGTPARRDPEPSDVFLTASRSAYGVLEGNFLQLWAAAALSIFAAGAVTLGLWGAAGSLGTGMAIMLFVIILGASETAVDAGYSGCSPDVLRITHYLRSTQVAVILASCPSLPRSTRRQQESAVVIDSARRPGAICRWRPLTLR